MSELNAHRLPTEAGRISASTRQLSSHDMAHIMTAISDMVAASERRQFEHKSEPARQHGEHKDPTNEPDTDRSVEKNEHPADGETVMDTRTIEDAALLDDFNTPWDAAAAEQLTRLYERGEGGLPTFTASAPVASGKKTMVAADKTAQPSSMCRPAANNDHLRKQFAIIQACLAQLQRGMNDGDRTWISDKFSGLAATLEASLSEVKQQPHSLSSIEGRLQQFEDRVCGAFDKLANNHVAEGLREIQNSLADFTAHLEKTQVEMSRIADIEKDIQELANRFSDKRIRAIAAELQSSREEIDPARFAEQVASNVAKQSIREINERLSEKQENEKVTIEAMAGLRGIVNDLLMEQRSEGKQTTGRLETIQASMSRIAERIEKLEAPQIRAVRPLSHKPAVNQTTTAAPTRNQEFSQPQVAQPTSPGHTVHRGDQSRQTAAKRDQTAEPVTYYGRFSTNQAQGPFKQDGPEKAFHLGFFSFRHLLAIGIIAVVAIGVGATSIMLGLPGDSAPQNVATDTPPAPDDISRETVSASAEPAGTIKPNANTVQNSADGQQTGETLPAITSVATPSDSTPQGTAQEPDQRDEQAQAITDLPNLTEPSSPVAAAIPASLVPPEKRKALAAPSTRSLPAPSLGPLSLRIAAADGDPSASFEVGVRFAEGKGVKQDFAEAIKWYSRSAAKGFPLAQYRLGALYERGEGTDVDFVRARVWYERAARKGNVKAMHNLAVLLASGQAGVTDYGAAAQWFREAAERGLADSKYNLAILYENGLGVSQDFASAYKWFALAARSGDKDADHRRRGLVTKLDKGTLGKADAAIIKWRPRPISRLANDPFFAGTQWKIKPNLTKRS